MLVTRNSKLARPDCADSSIRHDQGIAEEDAPASSSNIVVTPQSMPTVVSSNSSYAVPVFFTTTVPRMVSPGWASSTSAITVISAPATCGRTVTFRWSVADGSLLEVACSVIVTPLAVAPVMTSRTSITTVLVAPDASETDVVDKEDVNQVDSDESDKLSCRTSVAVPKFVTSTRMDALFDGPATTCVLVLDSRTANLS